MNGLTVKNSEFIETLANGFLHLHTFFKSKDQNYLSVMTLTLRWLCQSTAFIFLVDWKRLQTLSHPQTYPSSIIDESVHFTTPHRESYF